ncbi:copia protein [Tanacetum coccineum]
MSTSTTHQQSLVDAGSETRPPMLKRDFTPSNSQTPRLQTEDDLTGDDMKHYEAETEAMNLILISISNDIYNSVDACKTAQAMWQRVERLMRGTNEIASNFPLFTVNTKFLNCLQHEWLKYVTNDQLAKRLIEDTYDDLFDYLHQYEKLVNASRAKKVEKSHDPLTLVAHTGSSSRTPSPYYVTHPFSVVDYDDDYQGDAFQNNSEDPLTSAMMLLTHAITQRFSNPTNNRLRTSSNTRNQAIVQTDRENIQSRNSSNDDRNTRRSYNDTGNTQRILRTTSLGSAANVQCYNCSEKGHYDCNFPKQKVRDSKYIIEHMLLAKQDEAGVTLTDEHNDFLVADATRIKEIEELNNQEQKYPKQPKIINDTIGDDQIDINIIFDEPKVDVNSGRVEYDNNVQASYELEQLANYAFKKAENQQINANKADSNARRLEKDLQNQSIRDWDIIQDLEQKRDNLQLSIVELKRQIMELQKTQTILKRKMSENEDKYHDTVLDLEAKAKENENVVLKIGRSLQGVDTEDILDDATKSQMKMENKLKDPIAIEKKQNVRTIDYNKLNALYEDFVPQKELSGEQKYFSSTFIPSENPSNARTSTSTFETKPPLASMPSSNTMKLYLEKMENKFTTLFALLQTNSKRESIFYTTPEETRLTKFCQQEVKLILHKLHLNFEIFQKQFLEDIKEMKDVFDSTERLRATSSVRRPSNKDSSFKNSVLSNTKKSSEKVVVSVRTNKKTDVTSKNVVSTKRLRALFTTPRIAKSTFVDTTPVVLKTGFSIKTTQSKSLDTTPVVYKTKIAVVTHLSAKNKVAENVMWIVDNGCLKHMIEGDDLLTGARESNFYTISILDMAASSPICLMSKATSTKSWLWHRRLSHLNFGTINDLTKHDLVDGLLEFKYSKDHLCCVCERRKRKKSYHQPKLVPSTHSKLELLHMNLCGPIRVETINGKKYILVIIDDYSRFTWVYFLYTKDETPKIIKKSIAQVQLNYNAKIHKIRSDNGIEFKNATLKAHYEKLGIMQQFSIARTSQ